MELRSLTGLSVIGAICMLVAGLTAVVVPTASALTNVPIKVISYNMGQAQDGPSFDQLDARVVAFNPDVVLIQEVCNEGPYASYVAQKQAQGWHFAYTVFKNDRFQCGPFAIYGEVVMSRHPLTNVVKTCLSTDGCPGRDQFGNIMGNQMTCATVNKPSAPFVACDVHLPLATTFIPKVKSTVESHIASGKAVVLGGDFNMKPDNTEMSRLYRMNMSSTLTGPGSFFEADQARYQPGAAWVPPSISCNAAQQICRAGQYTALGGDSAPGEETFPKKIDYVFFSMNKMAGPRAVTLELTPTRSHHDILEAKGTMQF